MKNRFVFFRIALSAVLFCGITIVNAQLKEMRIQNATITGYNSETNLPNFIRFNPGKEIQEILFPEWAKTSLNIDASLTFKAYHTESDNLGYTQTRYQQYYQGYPVEGTMLIVHSQDGHIVSFNGDYVQQADAASKAELSEAASLQKALKKVNAKHYQWENKDAEEMLRQSMNDPTLTFYPKGELVVIHKKGLGYSAASFRLAYKFNIYAAEPLYRANVFVDALNGEILDEQNLICNMDVIGTAVTKYSSTVTMTSDNYGTGQYRLRETGRGNGIETYNLKNSSSYTNTDFTNTSATWNVSGTDQAASDAHWGAEQTYDYYHNTFGRNSIDGAGYKLLSYVHYSTNYVNAYWDGQRMTYGDGNPSQGYNIMTALDVCGHEITHGLTSNTAKLGTGEAGALNEGFSDIFGTTIESFARPNQHDWLMGADLMTNGKGLRDMSNPKSLNQPDTYKGANWDASGEVHTNDGPCIFWYYLMCQGKSGTNDIGSAYNVTAIGMSDAAKIAYRALTVYFTSATTYATARTYAIQAATDLFGACSQQVITCTNAWYAVGVGTQFDPSACSNAPVSDFSADVTNSCTGVINFTDLSTFNPTSWSWDFGDGGTSTLKNPSHAYTSNGTFTVILVTSNANGTNTKTKTAYITVNMPSSPITVNDSSCAPGIVHLSASGANTLNWYTAATGGTLINTGTTYAPSLSVTTTYYVANEIPKPIQNVGEPDNSKGGGYYTATTDRRIVFDVLANMILKTVKVYANTAGSRVIEVVNSAGTQVAVKTVTLPAGLSTVTLDFNLTPGTGYGIKIATGSTVDLYRSSVSNGLPYPYTINNLVSIKTSDAATNPNNYYYFFYDWEVQEPACSSALIPVTGSIVVCSGVNSVSADNFFNVYPNPASNGFVNIQKTAGDENNLAIEILNVMGEKIYSATIDNKQGMFNKTIDVSSYASGLYFISLKGKKNNITKKLLIE